MPKARDEHEDRVLTKIEQLCGKHLHDTKCHSFLKAFDNIDRKFNGIQEHRTNTIKKGPF